MGHGLVSRAGCSGSWVGIHMGLGELFLYLVGRTCVSICT